MPSWAVTETRGTAPKPALWVVVVLESTKNGSCAAVASVIRIVPVTIWLPLDTSTVDGVISNDSRCGGVVSTTGGGELTVQLADAGGWSGLLAASVARTARVCAPAASPVTVLGDEHDDQAPVSRRHSKLAPTSLAEKEKVALLV